MLLPGLQHQLPRTVGYVQYAVATLLGVGPLRRILTSLAGGGNFAGGGGLERARAACDHAELRVARSHGKPQGLLECGEHGTHLCIVDRDGMWVDSRCQYPERNNAVQLKVRGSSRRPGALAVCLSQSARVSSWRAICHRLEGSLSSTRLARSATARQSPLQHTRARLATLASRFARPIPSFFDPPPQIPLGSEQSRSNISEGCHSLEAARAAFPRPPCLSSSTGPHAYRRTTVYSHAALSPDSERIAR
ncbi:hypothetical protein L1887_57908 [Cichorium endivia]|nr:hypothetical protein L1887_57908 [Cichorium endivia]